MSLTLATFKILLGTYACVMVLGKHMSVTTNLSTADAGQHDAGQHDAGQHDAGQHDMWSLGARHVLAVQPTVACKSLVHHFNYTNSSGSPGYDLDGLLHNISVLSLKNNCTVTNITIVIENLEMTRTHYIATELNVTSVGLFPHLEVFSIRLASFEYKEPFTLHHSDALSKLAATLTYLRISANIVSNTSVTWLANLTALRTLDLSHNYFGAQKMLSGKHADLSAICRMPQLRRLFINRIQHIGMEGYDPVFSPLDVMRCRHNKTLPLELLFMESNDWGRIDYGLSLRFPRLRYLSVSRNLLVDSRMNAIFFFETILVYDSLRLFDMSCQGSSDCSNKSAQIHNKFKDSAVTSTSSTGDSTVTSMSSTGDSAVTSTFSTGSDTCPYDVVIWALKHHDCADDPVLTKACLAVQTSLHRAGKMGYSSKKAFCYAVRSTYAVVVGAAATDALCSLAARLCARLQLDHTCAYHLTMPVSSNLQEIYANRLAWDISSYPNSYVSNVFCFQNNSVRILDVSDNHRWLSSMRLSTNTKFSITTRGIERLLYLGNRNNFLTVNITQLANSTDNKHLLELDYGGNYALVDHGVRLCDDMPNLRSINAANWNVAVKDLEYSFDGCAKLTYLDLSQNDFGTDAESLQLRLSDVTNLTLVLRDCKIGYLSAAFRRQLERVERLTLTDNPLLCGCHPPEALRFVAWMTQHRHLITDFHNLTCSSSTGLMYVKDVDWKTLHRLNCPELQITVSVLVTTAFVSACALTVFLCVRFRWRIRYAAFVAGRACRRLCCDVVSADDDDDDGREFEFDAYISFATHDRHWVNNTLTSQLEQAHGLRLFNRIRQGLIGGTVQERIVTAMARCRHVLLVVSNRFQEKDWCCFELQQALLRLNRIREPARRHAHVIVIKLEPLENVAVELANILDTQACVPWTRDAAGQRLMWARLDELLSACRWRACRWRACSRWRGCRWRACMPSGCRDYLRRRRGSERQALLGPQKKARLSNRSH